MTLKSRNIAKTLYYNHTYYLQELLLSGGIDTPFTYKGYTMDTWLLEYTLQPGSMMPDAAAVEAIKQDPAQLAVIETNIAKSILNNRIFMIRH